MLTRARRGASRAGRARRARTGPANEPRGWRVRASDVQGTRGHRPSARHSAFPFGTLRGGHCRCDGVETFGETAPQKTRVDCFDSNLHKCRIAVGRQEIMPWKHSRHGTGGRSRAGRVRGGETVRAPRPGVSPPPAVPRRVSGTGDRAAGPEPGSARAGGSGRFASAKRDEPRRRRTQPDLADRWPQRGRGERPGSARLHGRGVRRPAPREPSSERHHRPAPARAVEWHPSPDRRCAARCRVGRGRSPCSPAIAHRLFVSGNAEPTGPAGRQRPAVLFRHHAGAADRRGRSASLDRGGTASHAAGNPGRRGRSRSRAPADAASLRTFAAPPNRPRLQDAAGTGSGPRAEHASANTGPARVRPRRAGSPPRRVRPPGRGVAPPDPAGTPDHR